MPPPPSLILAVLRFQSARRAKTSEWNKMGTYIFYTWPVADMSFTRPRLFSLPKSNSLNTDDRHC
jgi:hypothetical protein